MKPEPIPNISRRLFHYFKFDGKDLAFKQGQRLMPTYTIRTKKKTQYLRLTPEERESAGQ